MKNILLVFLFSVSVYSCKKVDHNVPVISNAKLTLATPDTTSFDGPFVSCASTLDLSGSEFTYGFCYSVNRNPVIPGQNNVSVNYSSGSFSAVCTNVEYGKKYYVRAFVTNGFATTYSNMDSFSLPLYLHTDTVRNITSHYFDVSIYTFPAAADSITERGICYDTLVYPDINDRKTTSTVADTGNIVIHAVDTTMPGKTYYLRSYFIANGRPVYGNQVTFKSAGYKGSYGFIVFDKGTTTNGWRYIEAAADSITVTTRWGCQGTSVPGTLTGYGAGLENSDTIRAVCSDTVNAASICRKVTYKARKDWYLPSVDELKAVYELKLSGLIIRNAVLFSSTEASANSCYVIDLADGSQQQIPKSSTAASLWLMRRY